MSPLYGSCYIRYEDVHFNYTKNNRVLNGVSMKINKGVIFALLGANGEGKSTMIKLLVGLIMPKFGRILIDGEDLGSEGLNVPGRLVGYMPQETALYYNLTIEQTLYYYGHVFGMSDKQIEDRIRYLYENIDLKERDKTIGTLSGGQQRSVSMALTLIHSPEVVIWDEPTVGLDPISRDKMWRFLFRLCREEGLTVLITTHYIEEAKQVDQVAFIHKGICLEQNSPKYLLEKYTCSTLEEVSYQACCNYQLDKFNRFKYNELIELKRKTMFKPDFNKIKVTMSHVKALLRKTALQYNNLALVFIFIITPIFGLLMPLFVFGPPRIVAVGLHDSDHTNLTKSFIMNLEKGMMTVTHYDDSQIGRSSVVKAKNLMFVEISEGFTEKVKEIKLGDFEEEPDNENNSLSIDQNNPFSVFLATNSENSIKLYLDMTNPVSSYYALVNFYSAFQIAMKENQALFDPANITRHRQPISMIPVKFEEPILGSFKVEFKDSMACAMLIFLTFDHAMFLSAFILIMEKDTGVKYRDRVSGITNLEVIVSVFIFTIIWTLTAIVAEIITLIICYDSIVTSKLLEASILMIIVGAEGVLIGIVLALVLKDKIFIGAFGAALQLILLIMSGVIWPIQALPTWLVPIATGLPFTLSVSSIQSLLISGLPIVSTQVMSGFIMSAIYLLVISIIIISLILI